MTATSGRKCSELLKLYKVDGLLAKTCVALLTSQWASNAAFLTWKASGIKPSHLLFQLAPSMPRTDATECGLLPTPRSCSAMAAENIQNRVNDKFPNLEGVVAKSLWPTSGEQLPNVVGGSLNPTFVEWLMGFPDGWTDLEASETPSSRKSSSGSEEQ